ncbi:type II/IV secretion system protein [Candidatus Parcubacteria bacterium]|nr:MAG: type II/IV secretion system protein [Candidatus Parcubacteria bacterium]
MMILDEKKLKELLIGPGYVSAAAFERAQKIAQSQNRPLSEVIIEEGLIKDEELGQLIAGLRGYKFINLRQEKIDEGVLRLIPVSLARHKGVIAFSKDNQKIKVGMTNPEDWELRKNLEKLFAKPLDVYYITPIDWREALLHYRPPLKEEFNNTLNAVKQSVEKGEKDRHIIKLVNMLIEHGYYAKASDIHIEPLKDKAMVRFRIDGVLHEVLSLPIDLLSYILMRIKVLAKMRIDEHLSAQDGKIRYDIDGERLDIRVSIVPVTEGENIVMRLLSPESRRLSLTTLGLSEHNLKIIYQAIAHPHGMILVTGPTGCGKTSTLYEMIKILNREEVHIATIEDPVEYDIEGVSQIQVNPKTNLTFAQGLRAIVRQDPDIIMVGEIRDSETADIAVNSAMTGHLVLSTLHTNNAVTAIPRLLEMGIEPFLISSTLNLVIAQRLVRQICTRCRVSYNITDQEIKIIKEDEALKEIFQRRGKWEKLPSLILYKGMGCKVCSGTGFRGRTGIFEILQLKETIKEKIIQKASADEIMKIAKNEGMVTMLEDGVNKALNATTTLFEVLRVIRE